MLASALAFAGACGDDSDDGGDPDAGHDAGGGTGGTGGTGGSGGTGGDDDPCPSTEPNCAEEIISEVCATLVSCDLIPGPDFDQTRCEAEITEDCVTCSVGSVAGDGGVTDGGASGCGAAQNNTECQDACATLIAPPTTRAECLDIQAAGTDRGDAYAECLCDTCMEEFATCVEDDGCFRVTRCASEANCNGMGCYVPCMAIIDEVGVTSISVALAQDLGNCTAATCDALKE
jgi:hypothetical protein